ncbi:hypothetical protein CABS01_02130 [Colletotrichum abscissum]|uniref:Uncharacterized protein n=1 Tax=Colletotrichum abscissum TaxID=1671311 RepID=A0A9P9XIT1_9PEZI|nr:uncharacterized protein CABS01_02130 [Colletotrichum abscissum]KAI3554514.1 hypothetical protein CABS02_05331 [Colletotrichum abscissum]KAK1488500.1 hypothetical protein CABS01_02130 [Colletotrichum abscissum]
MATYAHGTESLPGPVPGQPIGFLDGCESQSTQETGSTSLGLCKYEKRQNTDEGDRNQSLALIQRISKRHLIKQQESRNQPRSRELQQYLDVLKDAIPRLPDNNLTPSPELPTITFSRPRLAYPIIIKQRSSRTLSLKFTPTYPPGLQNCGIEKREFLRCIDDLNRVDEQLGPPGDHAMDINGFASMTAFTIARPTLLSMAIGVASSYRKHTTKRSAMTEILQKANKELFRPRGLVCVLVTCRRTEPKEPEKTPETGGTAASTDILDRTQEKRLKLRQRVVGRLRDFRWTELPQFEFYDEHNSHPDLDSHRLPARHSYRSRRRRSPSIEREDKTGLRQVIQENCENGNIGEGRQGQSTLKCGVSKHPGRTSYELFPLSGNKATDWDFVSNQSSSLGFALGKVEVESLTADFFTAGTDEDTTREEAQQTDMKPEHTSTVFKHRIYSQGKTLSSDALCLMILNSPEDAQDANLRHQKITSFNGQLLG